MILSSDFGLAQRLYCDLSFGVEFTMYLRKMSNELMIKKPGFQLNLMILVDLHNVITSETFVFSIELRQPQYNHFAH